MAHNSWFQFKQFTVWQENAAMKVGTDGVLLGVWVSIENDLSILDIGTGTGVIALILAQRSYAKIDAIDLEKGAIEDAQLNFGKSPWNERLCAIHSSLQEFVEITTKKYDCIVCNPPFFRDAVKSQNDNRTLARHTDSLSFDELAKGVSQLLKENGRFCVVLPIEAERGFRNEANKYRLFASKITRVKPKPSKPSKRILIEFRFEATLEQETELIIETENHHEYTAEFLELVRDFYLNY